MTPSARHSRPAASDDDIARGCIAALSFCLACGLLVYTDVLPLRWLPGQPIVLVLCLAALPIVAVWSTLRLARLDGLAAIDFARNVRLSQVAGAVLLLVVLPAAEERFASAGNGMGTGEFAGPVALCVGLALLASAMAGMDARAWSQLHAQVWEVAGAGGRQLSGGVERDAIVAQVRMRWIVGAAALAIAAMLHALRADGNTVQALAGLLAFLAYVTLGLVFQSLCARRRKLTYWQLTEYEVLDQVAREWNGLSLRVASVALLAGGLMLILPVLALAHAIVVWMVAMIARLLHLFNPSIGMHAPSATPLHIGSPKPPPRLAPPPATAHGEAGIFKALAALWRALIEFVQAHWVLLLGLLAVLIIARVYVEARRQGSAAGLWRSLLGILWRELMALGGLIWWPSRRLLNRVLAAQVKAASSSARRLWQRRGSSLDKLPPRSAIIAIYLAALKRLARRGFPRRPGQTPDEYASYLQTRLPDGQEPIEQLTHLFVAVRYGDAPAGRDEVSRAHALWLSLRKSLHRGHA